jgi:formiminotetrahydrofolate cyclodeaminase
MEGYLGRLASAAPTPGGGSAAALVAAMGAALVAMVARITLQSDRLADKHARARLLAEQADVLCSELAEARIADEAAYRAVVDAMALSRADDADRARRAAAIQCALVGAAEAPLKTAQLANGVLALVEHALDLQNRNLVSDAGCAAEFAAAALAAAALNVRVNHHYLKDPAVVRDQGTTLAALERDGHARLEAVRARVRAAMH